MKRIPSCGHPDKPYAGRGMCRTCYVAAYRSKTVEQSPLQGRQHAMAVCHPTRQVWSHGLCKQCARKKYRLEHQEREYETRRRWRAENKEQRQEYKKAYEEAHPESKTVAQHSWYLRNKDGVWAKNLKRKYGITAAQYLTMLELQGGGCAICGQPPGRRRLDVDHDHQTGAVRGLVCENHNKALGLIAHQHMQIAAEYMSLGGHAAVLRYLAEGAPTAKAV